MTNSSGVKGAKNPDSAFANKKVWAAKNAMAGENPDEYGHLSKFLQD